MLQHCKTRFRSLAVLNGTREKVQLVEVILSEMREKNTVENIKIKGDLGVINKIYKFLKMSKRSQKKENLQLQKSNKMLLSENIAEISKGKILPYRNCVENQTKSDS